MQLDYLVKDELEWELELREVTGVGTNKDMIRVLRGPIASEKGGFESFVEVKIDPELELDVCATKLDNLQPQLIQLTSATQQRKLETKLMHIIRRLEKVSASTDELIKRKSTLLQQAGNAMVDYEDLVRQFKKRSETQLVSQPLDPLLSSTINQTPSASTTTPNQRPTDEPSFIGLTPFKKTLVHKWQIRF